MVIIVKKIVLILLLVIVINLLFIEDTSDNRKEENSEEMKGIFFSYIEENNYFKNKTNKEIKKHIKEIINLTKKNNFNTIIIQVRSFSDALYNSTIFPKSINTSINILQEFIKESKKNNIKVYAWINPYRISNNKNEELPTNSPAYKWLGTDNVKILENGIYYNPAKDEVRDLIKRGVEEIVKNYSIAGLIFDDYFYPSNDIDILNYTEYIKTNNISLEEYHLDNVNRLIKSIHDSIKRINKNIKFGISPDGNIDNNYHKNFADVKKWCNSKKYIDFIMPQIYYGFENSTKPYIATINEWSNIIKDNSISLYFALAFYKIGNIDTYAKEGMYEWIKNDDIIMRQILIARNNAKYKGFALFRYDNLFNKNLKTKNTETELVNLQKVINKPFKS